MSLGSKPRGVKCVFLYNLMSEAVPFHTVTGFLSLLSVPELIKEKSWGGGHTSAALQPFFLPVLESLPVLLLLAVLSPRMRPGEIPLKLLALVMAGRGASRLELSELSVLLHGRGSPCLGRVSVSELLCRLAPDRPARNLNKKTVYTSLFPHRVSRTLRA